jgi:hypothetical protein
MDQRDSFVYSCGDIGGDSPMSLTTLLSLLTTESPTEDHDAALFRRLGIRPQEAPSA